MEKTLVAIVVSVITLFAAQNANGQEMTQQTDENAFVLAQTENNDDAGNSLSISETGECNYELWTSNGDIRYTNQCDCSIKLQIFYSYRSYRNENVNGRLKEVWSDWSSGNVVRWISANTGNGTVISGMSNEEYKLNHFKYLGDNCD
jgi:hypothetical protein